MAGFSCGGEGVHLKDEKTCAFKRAVSPFPHAPPQPHRHSSCEHLWGSSCPLCLFVGNRIDFPEHHWRQDRALGRTPQVQTSMQPWPQLLWMPRWAQERRRRPTEAGVKHPEIQYRRWNSWTSQEVKFLSWRRHDQQIKINNAGLDR